MLMCGRLRRTVIAWHIETNHVWAFDISLQTLCLGWRRTDSNADSNGTHFVGVLGCSPTVLNVV
jgi:hypothetical protein